MKFWLKASKNSEKEGLRKCKNWQARLPNVEAFEINQYLVNQRLLNIFMLLIGLFGQNIHMLCKKNIYIYIYIYI